MNRLLVSGRRAALPVPLLLLAASCYSWAPLEGVEPGRADPLRVHLVAPAPVSLGRISLNLAIEVDGELVRMDHDSVVLSATRVVDVTGAEQPGESETVSIERGNVAAIERRHISWLRSAVAGGAVAMLGGLTSALVGDGGGGRGGSGSGGQTK